MLFDRILGQSQAKHILSQALSRSCLAHAYLFYGPESIGKKLLAVEFAKALNCLSQNAPGAPCGTCESCRKIENRVHPDFFFLEPAKSTPTTREAVIKIEEIRKLQKKLGYLPYEGKVKVAVIDQVEKMNLQACNAFLKTLEEPPSATVLILVTSNIYQLLPTLISRCQGIKFNPLPPEAIREILQNQEEEMEPGEVDVRVGRAQGQVSRALSEEATQAAACRREMIGLIHQVSFQRMDLLFQWSKSRARGSEPLSRILEEMMGLIRDLTFIKSGGPPEQLFNRDLLAELTPVAGHKPLHALLKMADAVYRTQNALSGNANAQLALETMLLDFCEAA